MTPEEAEAFRAALESLLREHKVYLRVETGEVYLEQVKLTGYQSHVGIDFSGYCIPLWFTTKPHKPEPHPSQAPGRISPDTPY